MAVAFDAIDSTVFSNGSTADSWTHTPSGTPAGVLVYVVHEVGTDEVTEVTYGGSSLTEISASPLLKTTGEAAAVHAFFLGSSVPAGAQTVNVRGSFGDNLFRTHASITVTASDDTEVENSATVSSDSSTGPSLSLALNGETCYVSEAFMGGIGNPSLYSTRAGWSEHRKDDHGSNVGAIFTFDTVGNSDVTYGFVANADDVTLLAVAVRESDGAGGGGGVKRRPTLMMLGVGQ